ncbi:MAG: Gfo/Idh/MocA family oxidoreductase [Flavitalea sp.]
MSYRFALIGCGRIASRHAENILLNGHLAAVCDNIEAKVSAFALQNQAVPYSNFRQLLKNEVIDIVSICTPNGMHPAHAIEALETGHHVLCEKPMAISVKEGARMLEAARASGRKLFVVKQNRYNPPVAAVKRLLDKGSLGRILSFQLNCFWNRPPAYYRDSWKGTKAMDGGILFTQFSHFVDLLYWFLGEIKTVSGFRSNALHQGVIEFEDAGVASIIMQNGSIGAFNYHINSHLKNMEGSFTLFGEKGSVRIGGQYLNEIDFFSVDGEEKPLLSAGASSNQYGFYEGSMSNHHIVYHEVIRALDDPAHQVVEAADALKSIEMIEQIYAGSPFIE